MIVNYIQVLYDLLVPDKRQPTTLAYLSPIGYQLQLDNNNIFNNYKIGGSYNEWDMLTNYNRYDLIKSGKSVYYSSIDDNLGQYPNNFSGNWVLVTTNFIGVDSRVKFDGTKLIFEYAINTYFGTIYNPDTTLNSEIYLETLAPKLKSFVVGQTEKFSDKVLLTTSSAFIRKNNPTTTDDNVNLTIWVKDMGSVGKPTQDEIKNFADKYIISGVKFEIKNY